MDVTIMPSTSSLRKQLERDYPQFCFRRAAIARWSPREHTVYYASGQTLEACVTLLHELGHAIRGHLTYRQDVELLRCEREAWQTAKAIAAHYGLEIADDTVETALDSYRLWLHSRSRCPQCDNAATQTKVELTYRCLLCDASWSANDARQASLRRTAVHTRAF